ncbi:MAG: hypothetical protein IJG84_19240 [Kiritimatiellae bacterium]|nr:hypothetical protein [Kiritimatiellia bacterium]
MTSTRQIATAATCLFVLTSSALHASQTVIEGVSIEAADGSAWEYANDVLTLSGRGPYVLSGACTIGRVQARATCAEGTLLVASNLTLRGGAPLSVAAGASLVLALYGQNSFAGGASSAGIGVPPSASLTIQCAPRCIATNALLNAAGGSTAAGIGGDSDSANGAITIKGGIVTATGGDHGAGIGTGYKSPMGTLAGGDITVSGGRVVATGSGRNAAGIGGGDGVQYNGAVRINDGVVMATGGFAGIGSGTLPTGGCMVYVGGGNVHGKYTLTYEGSNGRAFDAKPRTDSGRGAEERVFTGFEPWQPVAASSLPPGYGARYLTADADGEVRLYLGNSISGYSYSSARVAASETTVGVTANGTDVGERFGIGWDFSPSTKVLTLDGTEDVVLSSDGVTNSISVLLDAEGAATVTLSNLCLLCEANTNPVSVASGTDARIFIAGTNALVAKAIYNGLGNMCGVCVPSGASVVIDKAEGLADDEVLLEATGNISGSGIGAPGNRPGGRVEIRGGTIIAGTGAASGVGLGNCGGTVAISGGIVTAIGNEYGAGIGANYERDAGTTIISGGIVHATGGRNSCGIGGNDGYRIAAGVGYDGGTIAISGGIVTAVGGGSCAGIGSGYRGTGGRVTITGGTVTASGGTTTGYSDGSMSCDVGGGRLASESVVIITGGSVKGTRDMITNAVNAAGAEVVRHVLGGLEPGRRYSLEDAPARYGKKDLFADENGELHIWCDAGLEPRAVEWTGGGDEPDEPGEPDEPTTADATSTTPVPVPYAWLDAYPSELARHGGDYELFGNARAANGLFVWSCYVAGLNPTNAESRFTAYIQMRDGRPLISWTPDLNTNGEQRVYTIWGATNLENAVWYTPTNSASRFFRVEVSMP